MATAEERLTEWLRDAHAAEEQAETMLSGMAGRIKSYPELKKRIEQHLRRHSAKPNSSKAVSSGGAKAPPPSKTPGRKQLLLDRL